MSYTNVLKCNVDEIKVKLTKVVDELMDEVQDLQMSKQAGHNSKVENSILHHLEKAEGYLDYASYQLQLAKRIMT